MSRGQLRTVIGAIGDREQIQTLPWEAMAGVEKAVPVLKSFRFVSRDFQSEDSVIEVGNAKFGGGHFTAIAGPCAAEDRDQVMRTAEAVKMAGAKMLRGDAFKPRTSPYAFQGLGEAGLQLMAEAREEFELPFVAEVLDSRDVGLVSSYADVLRIGTRNMSNFTLLAEVGRQPRPVQLKRGFTATMEEWLNAAEYIYKEGNHQIILVERGNPDLRDGGPQHPRHHCGPSDQRHVASADTRRPVPLGRAEGVGRSAGEGRGCGRSRRDHGRCPSDARHRQG